MYRESVRDKFWEAEFKRKGIKWKDPNKIETKPVKKKKVKKTVLKKKRNYKPTDWFYSHESGKLTASPTELIIKKVLQKQGLIFYSEISFRGLKSNKGGFPRFDFYLPEYNLIIEYDGKHHKAVQYQEKDRTKDAFCELHNIHVERFNADHWLNLSAHVTNFLQNYSLHGKAC